MVITDEMAQRIAASFVQIHGELYKADLNCKVFAVGDYVLDRQDGTHSTVEEVYEDHCTLRDGYVAEGLVSFDRLIKLNLYNVGAN